MNKVIFEELRTLIENKTGREISETDEIRSLGMDSIEFVELIIKIEECFNLQFPIENLTLKSVVSVSDFVLLVESICDDIEA